MSKSPRDTGGPTVKTGPTRGENRSRRDDGGWRRKRSDAGKSREKKDKKGCFLTTAACQHRGLSDHCHELEVLRSFRDNYLIQTETGRALVDTYYREAPTICDRISSPEELEEIWMVVATCVSKIEDDQPEAALRHYASLFEALRKRHLDIEYEE